MHGLFGIKYNSIIPFVSIMTQLMRNLENADELLNVILGHASTDAPQRQSIETHKQIPTEISTDFKEVILHPHYPFLSNFQQSQENSSFLKIVCDEGLSQHSQKYLEMPITQKAFDQQPHTKGAVMSKQRHQKNSNAIKKIGRIILDNLREYSRDNSGVQSMLKLLSRDSKIGRTEVNKRDKFNTFHLRVLLGGKNLQLVRANLRTTRRILTRNLRKNVLLSRQITSPNKAIYLNTMKCSALRCLHQSLAVRLQMSQ